jgi:hypothetical protein
MGAKDGILASSGPSFDIQARHPVLVTTSELWSVRFHVLLGSSINLFLTHLDRLSVFRRTNTPLFWVPHFKTQLSEPVMPSAKRGQIRIGHHHLGQRFVLRA